MPPSPSLHAEIQRPFEWWEPGRAACPPLGDEEARRTLPMQAQVLGWPTGPCLHSAVGLGCVGGVRRLAWRDESEKCFHWLCRLYRWRAIWGRRSRTGSLTRLVLCRASLEQPYCPGRCSSYEVFDGAVFLARLTWNGACEAGRSVWGGR